MATTLHFNAGVDLTGMTDFVTDYSGRLYGAGQALDASGVIVTLLPTDSTRATLSNLPLDTTKTYAVSMVVSNNAFAVHYSHGQYYSWRLIPFRKTGQTVGSLDLTLSENGVESAVVLSVTEGVTGAGDWIATGWTEAVGDYGLTWIAGAAGTEIWSVAVVWTAADTGKWAKDRLGAHNDLKKDGFLVCFSIAVLVDKKVSIRSPVNAYALDVGTKEKQLPAGRLEERQVFMVAALQADGVTLLDLEPARDQMLIDGRVIAIDKTGPIRPGNVTLLYEVEISTARLGGR